jgi:hypothetical protein
MTTDLDKQARIERHKTIRAILWVVALLIVAAVLFGVYRFVTAPVRMAQNTTQTITQQVEETATAVLTHRHIKVREGRRYSRMADRAHTILINLPETKPASLRDRTFRLAHLRGSQSKVCQFVMDFGAGPVPVWTAADNAEFTANRSLGGEASRQLRIIWETPTMILGVSVQYADKFTQDDNAPRWELLWRRRDSIQKPLTDAVVSERTMNALAAIPQQCATP